MIVWYLQNRKLHSCKKNILINKSAQLFAWLTLWQLNDVALLLAQLPCFSIDKVHHPSAIE
jgi:hypothetical protein